MNGDCVLECGGALLLAVNGGSTFDYFLWGSLLVLITAPFILSRTRWAESRTLTICVTLSLLAHTLFMVYAYATRVPYAAYPVPGATSGDGPIISLNLLGDDWLPTGGEPALSGADPLRSAADDARIPVVAQTPEQSSSTLPTELVAAVQTERAAKADSQSLPSSLLEPVESKSSDLRATVPELIPNERPVAAPLPETSPAEAIAAAAPSAEGKPSEVPLVETESSETQSAKTQLAEETQPAQDPSMESSSAARELPLRRADQQPVPQLYRNRMESSHLGLALRYGGNEKTEAAVKAALRWLALHQSPDGRWDPAKFGAGQENRALGHDRGGAGAHADTGITALALLALLGSGQTHLEGEYREQVQHGLEFLMRQQRTDGELGGSAELFARMYCHSMSTLALGEAYSMTGDQRLRPFLERAVRYTLAAQDPQSGGWRYRPGDSGDMSQFGWQVMSLKSAQLSRLEVPERTRLGMLRFLDQCQAGSQRGLASYRPGERPSRTMTAESIVCRLFVGAYQDAQLVEAERFLLEEPPQAGKENFYYWYYGTLAMFQMQGEGWPKWNQALQRELLAGQRTDGDMAGSWNPDPLWGSYGGRVFSTAFGALCLEVYYRYLPLYQTARATPTTSSTRR